MAMLGDSCVVTRVRPGVSGGARGRGAWGADFARGREARGASQRPRAPLPTLLAAGSTAASVAAMRSSSSDAGSTESGVVTGASDDGVTLPPCAADVADVATGVTMLPPAPLTLPPVPPLAPLSKP